MSPEIWPEAELSKVNNILQTIRGITIDCELNHMTHRVELFDIWGFRGAVKAVFEFLSTEKGKKFYTTNGQAQSFCRTMLDRNIAGWESKQKYPIRFDVYHRDKR